jgi:hypothetical protein
MNNKDNKMLSFDLIAFGKNKLIKRYSKHQNTGKYFWTVSPFTNFWFSLFFTASAHFSHIQIQKQLHSSPENVLI